MKQVDKTGLDALDEETLRETRLRKAADEGLLFTAAEEANFLKFAADIECFDAFARRNRFALEKLRRLLPNAVIDGEDITIRAESRLARFNLRTNDWRIIKSAAGRGVSSFVAQIRELSLEAGALIEALILRRP